MLLVSVTNSFASLAADEIKILQPLIDSGMLPTSLSGKDLNPSVYQGYGLGVYGSPWGTEEKMGEYCYLGYTYDDQPIANDKYIGIPIKNII